MKYLFTTLPSNDLGLVTRSLPIAAELRGRGADVTFSSPARAPRTLIAEAGFPNLAPVHPRGVNHSARRAGHAVVLTTGHHALRKKLPPLPANVIHERYVPRLAMAARSDVLIHHGGYGSCQTALHAAKPSVILPTYTERESNARRLEQAGAGIIVPVHRMSGRKHVDADALRSAVYRVLQDESFSRNARRIGENLQREGGARRAAELIEDFAGRRQRRFVPVVQAASRLGGAR
jgi:UDP:flavonoid glycosyltransferase YjiC (YdhE family)